MLAGVVTDMSDEQTGTRVPLERRFGRQLHSYAPVRGTVLSAVVHLAIIGVLLWMGQRHFFDASQAPGDPGKGGGGGGGGIRGLAVFTAHAMGRPPTPQPPAVQHTLTVPQQVEPLPATPPRDTTPVAAPSPTAPSGAGEGPGQGAGLGPGAGTGTGGGTGGGIGPGIGNDSGAGGSGGTIFPPSLQGLLLQPPNPPRELRGVPLRITFRIDERGNVVSVDVDPPIRDRGYRNDFLDRMRHYTFAPGHTRDGHPVAAEYVVTLTIH